MSTTPELEEKRRFRRVTVVGDLRYRRIPITLPGIRHAAVRDVSEGGFRVRSEEQLTRKSTLLLELRIPGSDPIRSLATVAWVRPMPADDGYEIGGMFVEPTREARTALSRFLSTHR
jgi:hypothetical protein